MGVVRSFRELNVYQLSRDGAQRIFNLSKKFPIEERYSLTDQIRRSSRAVKAMIAEAWARRRRPLTIRRTNYTNSFDDGQLLTSH
jgi:four helix bundle protein